MPLGGDGMASWAAVAQAGIVVVGASLAGLRAVETLRTDGYAGPITLIGAERHLPYDRPPLSKKLLAGEWEPDRIAIRPAAAIDELALDLRLGVPAVALDGGGRAVELADGTTVPYDGLIVATGSATRRLPGQEDVATVHELRTLDDALVLRSLIADGTARVVVVGAGFIGLEVAATARCEGLCGDRARGPAGAARARARRGDGRARHRSPRRRRHRDPL